MLKKNKDYQIKKFSPTRQILASFNDVAASFPRVMGLLDIEITKAQELIVNIEKKDNYKVSFTGWVAKCVSKAISENMRFNTFRKRRNRVVVFDKIDISVMVEITTKDGKQVPFNHVIRDVESKSVKEISDEIRNVQNKKIEETEQLSRDRGPSKGMVLYAFIPSFIREPIMKRLLKNPFYLRNLIGTVGITSFGKNVKTISGYAIPFSDKTLNVAIGGMKERAVVRDGKLVNLEYVGVTFMVDHNIVDGAPIARFCSRVSNLMREAYGLEDISKN